MSIQFVKTHTLAELLGASNVALGHACAERGSAALIVPTHSWAQQRKAQLRTSFPLGVNVQAHRQWVSALWDVYGDGSTVVDPETRRILLRPLITQVGLLQSNPSPKLVASLGAFVEEAIAPGLAPHARLSESQAKAMELVSLYEHKLELEGHIELAQAEAALVKMGACAQMHIVFECPDLQSAHINRFLAGVGSVAHVTVVSQELDAAANGSFREPSQGELEELRGTLFTGNGGTAARGNVHVGEAHGAHVAAKLATRLAGRLHEQYGIEYKNMLICSNDVADAYPRLFETLASAEIPFIAQFGLPCARTGLGSAFANVERIALSPQDESTYEHLVDFANSPYSGLRGEDARALQMRWRERSHSTANERMADIRSGFTQGNATSAMMAERLKPLAEILDAPRSERVRMMFANARNAHLDANTLVDDKAAAECLLDYLELCDRYYCEPHIDEMTNLSVSLTRAYGDSAQGLSIVSAAELGLTHAQAIIFVDLDAAHYPMAVQEGPFDKLMSLLGIAKEDTLAYEQRLLLLNAIENCESHFAFCRATHDAMGAESCPSALFEEILAAYRTPADDEANLPLYAIPHALLPWSLSISEADAFFESGDNSAVTEQAQFTRGVLKSEWSRLNLIIDLQQKFLPFSPTGIEDYYRCPYRWFACRRVGYNGMDNAFDASSQGNLVHATMERFYKDLHAAGHERVTLQNLEEALRIASTAFDFQVEHEKNRSRGGLYVRTQRDEQECEELRKKVLAFIERDAEFLPGFTPTYFELTLGKGTGNMLEYAGVPVRGKVDRIDVDAQGNAVIIDYKLSGLSAGYGFAADDDLPLRIQTDIYALLVQRHFEMLGTPICVVGSVYRSNSTNLMRGVYTQGIEWGNVEQRREQYDALPRLASNETYDEYLARVEDRVTNCMERLRAGDIAPNPIAKGVCEYCKALSFCPRGEA